MECQPLRPNDRTDDRPCAEANLVLLVGNLSSNQVVNVVKRPQRDNINFAASPPHTFEQNDVGLSREALFHVALSHAVLVHAAPFHVALSHAVLFHVAP